MEGSEVRKLAALEDTHWWYAERRHILSRMLKGRTPGRALDIGAAGGGNTRVLRDMGWQASPLEFGLDGAQVCHERGLPVMRADATMLPLADASLDIVTAFDVLEHLEDDDACVREVRRVLKPGGAFLVAVPCDPKLWSAHDDAVDHVRRYTRQTLHEVLERDEHLGEVLPCVVAPGRLVVATDESARDPRDPLRRRRGPGGPGEIVGATRDQLLDTLRHGQSAPGLSSRPESARRASSRSDAL